MCYPKPGPRCSDAGRKSYKRAQDEYKANPSEDNYGRLRKAREEYFCTTEGLERLEKAVDEAKTNKKREEATHLLAHFQNERHERIEVSKKTSGRTNSELYTSAKSSLMSEGFEENEITKDMIGARIRAQRVVAGVPGLVHLDKPGSQSDSYVRDENGKVSEVYYASYGSNLFADRFGVYVQGGEVNGTTKYEGCRDKTPPKDDVKLALPGSIHYAGESYVWTGGPAFLDTSVAHTASLGRAYRVSTEQFEDVVAQESMTPIGEYSFDSDKLLNEGHITTPGLYGKLEHVGDYNGAPVLTFTSPFTSAQARSGEFSVDEKGNMTRVSKKDNAELRKKRETVSHAAARGGIKNRDGMMKEYPVYTSSPAPAYLNTIANGIKEAHGLSREDADTYFNGSMGAYRPKN